MRYLAAVVIAVLGLGAWYLEPAHPQADLGVGPKPAQARFAACVGREDRLFSSSVSVAGSFVAPATITRAAGTAGPRTDIPVDDSGSGVFEMTGLGTTGLDGAFVEFGSEDSYAGVLASGPGGVMGAACTPPSSHRLVAVGLSTRNAESLDLVLVNPYAADAVVTVDSSSEVGPDSASELAQVLIPARSTVVRDLSSILPLRQQLSVSILVTRGAAHAFLMQSGQGDTKLVEAVETSTSWFLPLPDFDGVAVTIANPGDSEVDVRVDLFVDGTLQEGAVSEIIAPRSHLVIDRTGLGVDPGAQVGLAVFAASEVAVGFGADGEGIRAGGPAPAALSGNWVVPARFGGPATIWVLNPDDIELAGVIRPLIPGVSGKVVTLAPSSVTAIPVDGLGAGYSFSAPGDVAVTWTTRAETGLAAGRGSPLAVIGEED